MGFLKRSGGMASKAARAARETVAQVPGCTSIATCQPRRQGRVAGIVESIKLVPREGIVRLEITIADGTGELTGVWFGQHRIAGLELGERVMFEGMIGSPGGGKLEILHPAYQLLGAPVSA